MASTLKSIIIFFSDILYRLEQSLVLPVVTSIFSPERAKKDRDVLHTGYLTVQPRIICECLKSKGLRADYMAFTHRFSKSSWLKADEDGADFIINSVIPLSCVQFFGELWRFYTIVLKYKIIHCHALRFASSSGWELQYLKRTGTKIVIHYRGCDIRNPLFYSENPQLIHNSCEECDYEKSYCVNIKKNTKIALAEKFADAILVTTPDLLDLVEKGQYFPFFAPTIDVDKISPKRISTAEFEIVHATNHEGIDGTKYILNAVEKLKAEGMSVYLNLLKRTPYEETLAYYKGADIAVGKLFMGFYANSQIESMIMGTPTVTYIRDDLKNFLQGLDVIVATPENIFEVLKKLLLSPKELREIGKKQMEQVKKIHNNDLLSNKLIEFYKNL